MSTEQKGSPVSILILVLVIVNLGLSYFTFMNSNMSVTASMMMANKMGIKMENVKKDVGPEAGKTEEAKPVEGEKAAEKPAEEAKK